MLLKDCATYVSDRIDSIHLSDTTYISTDNMLPDRRGIEPSSCVPNKGNVTAFKPGDILLSNIRPYFKKIWLADRSGGCCADVLVLRADRRKMLPEILYLILSQDSFFEYVMAGAKGSKMPRGDKQQIMTYPVVLPSEEELAGFNTIASPLLEQIYSNRAENKRLSILRDNLLPKLMSGEINVSAVEI